jgi:hypothetical protein
MARAHRAIATYLIGVFLLAGATAQAQQPAADAQNILAPSGKLRVGLYPGTPTSILDPR